MHKTSLSIQVDTNFGELSIKILKNMKLINNELKIKNTETSLLIPIKHQPNSNELEALKSKINFQITTADFIPKKQHKKKIEELLTNKIPNQLLKKIPHSMDVIGDIAIIEIPIELKKYNKILGEGILRSNKNIKVVLSKSSPIKKLYRIRNYDFISGEKRTDTIHLEYGYKYFLDITKVYFSPRLSQEHNRIASLVEPNEVIVDLFAGVGPFSIPIANKNHKTKIFSIDINPLAIEFLKKNIRLNRVNNKIIPYLGDARLIVNDHLSGLADRVIMNLPEKAFEFIDVACRALKASGGIIHYYEFIQHPDSIEKAQLRFTNRIKQSNRSVDKFLFIKNVRETAPYQHQVVFDVKIN